MEFVSPSAPLYGINTIPSVSKIEGAGRLLALPGTIEHPIIGLAVLYGEGEQPEERLKNSRYYAAIKTTTYWEGLAAQNTGIFDSDRYKFSPIEQDSNDPFDGTSYVPGQHAFRSGKNRADLAPICLQLNPTVNDFEKHKDEPVPKWVVCVNGVCKIIVDAFDLKPLNFFDLDLMPVRVSRKIDGFRVAQILRQDCRIKLGDFVQRMTPFHKMKQGHWVEEQTESQKLIRATDMRYRRFCEQSRLLIWPVKKPEYMLPVDLCLLEELKIKDPDGMANNTTAALEVLSAAAVKKLKVEHRGKQEAQKQRRTHDVDAIPSTQALPKERSNPEDLDEGLRDQSEADFEDEY